ncbi:hypothetical protein OUZ56_005312 [Daphnia magna]|uniref:Uncharacterized protein n=1 Tax=Daphnia magna TaxID=35525 RepID=A0ABQ9YSG5_9CRUS|nr:hypothetical protein OUZ56_005312 [Daphnia magna]
MKIASTLTKRLKIAWKLASCLQTKLEEMLKKIKPASSKKRIEAGAVTAKERMKIRGHLRRTYD